jgi:glucose-1-phosphate thymidylyltransferase
MAVVGVLPAAGRAERLSPLPCSKEIFPIGFRPDEQTRELRPMAVSHHLFEKFRSAGIGTAFVILRSGKWDIPSYYTDGRIVGVEVAYKVITESIGPPDTIDRAYPFVRHSRVAFAFPDMIFGPDDVFRKLLERLEASRADAVLGLYATADIQRMDMIDADTDGRVRAIVLKPNETPLQYTWTCAVWQPTFTEYLHECVQRERQSPDGSTRRRAIDAGGDLPVGAVLQAAIRDGLSIQSVAFPGETFIDIGTPASMRDALHRFIDGG